jgi:glycosyltransferase involved in cell wall biosynthesis
MANSDGGQIVMLVENAYPADVRVRNEARSLAQAGYQVSVIALRKPEELRREIVEGVKVYRVPRLTLFKKTDWSGSFFLLRWLSKLKSTVGYFVEYFYFTCACLIVSTYLAVAEGFDVVHAHNPPDTLFIVGAVHKIFGKKFVFDHHDLSPELYRSRFGATAGVVTRVLGALEFLSYRVSDLTIATNESYREVALTRGKLTPDRVTIVRNGPDLKRVRRVEPDAALKATGKTILVYVGAMNPQDGVDYLLRALQHLAFEMGRTDFYCVLVGSGDSFDDLKAEASAAGLDPYVRFTGFIPEEDLRRYLSTADICLDPNPSSPLNDVSTWIKVMEYMAMAKPTISFDLKETRFTAREAALYVRPNDVREFAKAVATLMDDPVLREQMSAAGRARVEAELNWSVSAGNLLAGYDRLFAVRPQARPAPRREKTTTL